MYIHVSEQISGSSAGGIAGGVAGVLVVVILMVLLIILITLAVKRTRRSHCTNTQVQGENNQYSLSFYTYITGWFYTHYKQQAWFN